MSPMSFEMNWEQIYRGSSFHVGWMRGTHMHIINLHKHALWEYGCTRATYLSFIQHKKALKYNMQPKDYFFLVHLASELVVPTLQISVLKVIWDESETNLHGVDSSCWMDEKYAHAHRELAQMSFVRVWLYNVPLIHPTKKNLEI